MKPKRFLVEISLCLLLFSNCQTRKNPTDEVVTISFGSCDNQALPNSLWNEVLKNQPDLWIWGGDNIYCDTDDMSVLEKCYQKKLNDPSYRHFTQKVKISGTWDDHDYARNDGGQEFPFKNQSQKLFLDFMKIPESSPLRKQKGIYHSFMLKDQVKIIILDTRYHRTALVPDESKKKRYLPTHDKNASILGEEQWEWLENELRNSNAKFNIIVSSIQFLSDRHGFEMWGNMPHEVEKLEKIMVSTKAKGVMILSGDRHIAEISKKSIEGLSYPLIDFTSSGLTHVYSTFKQEENPYRISKVISKLNFGLVKINLSERKVIMEIRGIQNELLEQHSQSY